ncbi:hypothetical protein BJV82DRAFT_636450 [Fennellomyces sp. T-0311]|nr:hypothetical protein BJV82DRAFT_636450 [Fennellomyces sp. T-0311]
MTCPQKAPLALCCLIKVTCVTSNWVCHHLHMRYVLPSASNSLMAPYLFFYLCKCHNMIAIEKWTATVLFGKK